jgi:hypothetical protein
MICIVDEQENISRVPKKALAAVLQTAFDSMYTGVYVYLRGFPYNVAFRYPRGRRSSEVCKQADSFGVINFASVRIYRMYFRRKNYRQTVSYA